MAARPCVQLLDKICRTARKAMSNAAAQIASGDQEIEHPFAVAEDPIQGQPLPIAFPLATLGRQDLVPAIVVL